MTTKTTKMGLPLLGLVFGLTCATGVQAKKKQVMNKGYDVVAYHQMMGQIQPKKGIKKHKVDYQGKTYWFMSDKNKQAFTLDPQRYVVPYTAVGTKGEDMVAYHQEKEKMKPAKGKKKHQWKHDGMTYYFKNAENMKLFKQTPEKYAPIYNGYCAYGVAMNKRVGSSPQAWDIIEGRLYLNLDRDVQERWRQNLADYIKDADTNWPQLQK